MLSLIPTYLAIFSVFMRLSPKFFLFTGLDYIDGADSTVSFSLWKAIVFTEASKFSRSTAIQEVRASLRRWHQRGRRKPVWFQILFSPIFLKGATSTSMMHLKVTRKGMPLVRSRIHPSPILLKKVTAMKNSCSLDDFLTARSSIKRNIMTL